MSSIALLLITALLFLAARSACSSRIISKVGHNRTHGHLGERPHRETAVLLKGHLRRLEELAGFWKWFVETEDVDVFIVTQSPVVEKSGARTPVNVTFVREVFGERLRLLHVIHEGTVEHDYLIADTARAASYLPSYEDNKSRNPARHYAHYWLLHRAFMIAGGALKQYKRVAALRTDFVLTSVPIDLKTLTGKVTDQCPTDESKWPSFQLITHLKAYEKYVSHFDKWGFSVSDYLYLGSPSAIHALSLLRDWMWVRVPPPGAVMRRPGYVYSSEAQFYLQRVIATNISDLRDIGVPMSTVVVRETACEVRHVQKPKGSVAANVIADREGFDTAQLVSPSSTVLWTDPTELTARHVCRHNSTAGAPASHDGLDPTDGNNDHTPDVVEEQPDGVFSNVVGA